MNKDLVAIFEYLEREKGIKRDVVVHAIEESLHMAARKCMPDIPQENVAVHIDPKTGEIFVSVKKLIVEAVTTSEEEISLKDAKLLNPLSEIGQEIKVPFMPKDFGRIAAQTARQLISQKLRLAERDVIYEEYRHRINELISGTVKQIVRGKSLMVDLGKVEAILPERNYPKTEKFHVGERVQALLLEVHDTDNDSAEVVLTRSHPEFVKQLFISEVPELHDGTISIEKIVREPGYRTKIAVRSYDSKVDPVGTCVGVRGTRIKNIIRELNNEKIDVIPYADDSLQLLQNAVAPVEIKRIKVSENRIVIVVNDEDYPIIIGKKGMNARLIARLLEVELTVQKMTDHQKLIAVQMVELGYTENPILDQPLKIEGISSLIIESLISAGFDTIRKTLLANPTDLIQAAPGLNYLDMADKLTEQIQKKLKG
ncbi:MAG: transcription termination factor NusA [Chlamydiota bacterium]